MSIELGVYHVKYIKDMQSVTYLFTWHKLHYKRTFCTLENAVFPWLRTAY